MVVHSKVLFGKSMSKIERKKMIRALKENRPLKGIYCLCMEDTSHFSLEILESKEFYKEINEKKEYRIIGIAKGQKEAFELVETIIGFLYRKYGDPLAFTKEFD